MKKKYNYFLGIDGGITGALALVIPSEIKLVFPYEPNAKDLLNIYKRIVAREGNICAVIEDIWINPKQSFKNQRKYIETFFRHIYLLELFKIDYQVKPIRTWKKEFGLNSEKRLSVELAHLLFDNSEKFLGKLIKDNNEAEAVLLAEYARRIF